MDIEQFTRSYARSVLGALLVIAAVVVIGSIRYGQERAVINELNEADRQRELAERRAEERARQAQIVYDRLIIESKSPSRTLLSSQSQSQPDWQFGHRGRAPENFGLTITNVDISFVHYVPGLIRSMTTRMSKKVMFEDIHDVRRGYEDPSGVDTYAIYIDAGVSWPIYFVGEAQRDKVFLVLVEALDEWHTLYGHL